MARELTTLVDAHRCGLIRPRSIVSWAGALSTWTWSKAWRTPGRGGRGTPTGTERCLLAGVALFAGGRHARQV